MEREREKNSMSESESLRGKCVGGEDGVGVAQMTGRKTERSDGSENERVSRTEETRLRNHRERSWLQCNGWMHQKERDGVSSDIKKAGAKERVREWVTPRKSQF